MSLTEKMEKQRTRATLQEHGIDNTRSSDFPGAYYGWDGSWNFDKFKKKFDVKFIKYQRGGSEMEFDLIGIDPAIANAFRRLMISEVPTMAIEKVFIYNNTSVIQDEVLAHRLGLIPINANPKLFEYRQDGDLEGTPEDTIEFKLQIKCTKNPNATKDSITPDDLYLNHSVYTKHLEWIPLGAQSELHGDAGIGPIHDDILLAKLRLGHEIDLKVHCVKGIGVDHAKFSPVATATYRLLPEIIMLKPVYGEMAERLKTCFSPGVIEIEEQNGMQVAIVANPRRDTGSRNHLKYDDLQDCVEINRVKDHFIFSIESTSSIPADEIMVESIKILMGKCQSWLRKLESGNVPFLSEQE